MLQRRPSLTSEFEWCFAGDPALEQPPTAPEPGAAPELAAAHVEQLAAYHRRLQVARDTGSYTALTIPGLQPTRFVVRCPSTKIIRWLKDEVDAGRMGQAIMLWNIVQVALRGIVNFDVEWRTVTHPRFGVPVAHDEILEAIDQASPHIIAELAGELLVRSAKLDPLSLRG